MAGPAERQGLLCRQPRQVAVKRTAAIGPELAELEVGEEAGQGVRRPLFYGRNELVSSQLVGFDLHFVVGSLETKVCLKISATFVHRG